MYPRLRSVWISALLLVNAGHLVPNTAAAPRDSIIQLFADANSLYQRGDFSGAEHRYLQLLDRKIENGAVFYNLGNACFKQKKLGEAIYFWKKAGRKLPGDQDIRENIDLANLLIVDRIEVSPDPLPMRWLDALVHRLTIAQDTWIAMIFFLTANSLFAGFLLVKKPRWSFRALVSSMIAGCLTIVFCSSIAWKIYEMNYNQEGIVVEQKADVRSGPGTDNVAVFTVHEGIQLRIRGETADWYQVSLANGWSGWLPRNTVRLL